jgi:sugar fermentation stimulation protein A
MRRPGRAEFPDARTERGRKHLEELGDAVEAGSRSVMLYLIQIGSAERFSLARDIDPKYGAAFDRARSRGVEAIAWRCVITRDGIDIVAGVPIAE